MTIAADQAYQHDFGCKKRRLAIRQEERIAFTADIASFSFELLMHSEGQTLIMVFDNLKFDFSRHIFLKDKAIYQISSRT